jgi:hypothetical protein
MPEFAKAVLGRLFPELVSYLPLIPLLQRIAAGGDPVQQSLAIMELLRFGTAKTPTAKDDELLALLEPVMRTPEGEALVRWVAEQLTAGIFAMEGPQP